MFHEIKDYLQKPYKISGRSCGLCLILTKCLCCMRILHLSFFIYYYYFHPKSCILEFVHTLSFIIFKTSSVILLLFVSFLINLLFSIIIILPLLYIVASLLSNYVECFIIKA